MWRRMEESESITGFAAQNEPIVCNSNDAQ